LQETNETGFQINFSPTATALTLHVKSVASSVTCASQAFSIETSVLFSLGDYKE